MDKIVGKLHSPAWSLVKTLGSTITEATITAFHLAHIFEMWSYLEIKHVLVPFDSNVLLFQYFRANKRDDQKVRFFQRVTEKETSAIPSQEEILENITISYVVESPKQLDSFIKEY